MTTGGQRDVLGQLETGFIVPFSFDEAVNGQGLAPLPDVADRVVWMVDTLTNTPHWRRDGRRRGTYFHRFAEEALRRFVWLRWQGARTCTVVLDKDKENTRQITDITLKVELSLHPSGAGMLVTTLSHDHIGTDDMLLLNERFRILVRAWDEQPLPRMIDIGRQIDVFDGSNVDGWQNGWVRSLLGPLIGDASPFSLTPPSDPRAFVHTWCGLPHPPNDRLWQPFSWVDTAPGHSANTDPATMAELRRAVDYRRWWEGKTRYGVTRYSFTCMQQIGPGHFTVRQHMASLYRDLVVFQLLRKTRLLSMQQAASRLAVQLSADRPYRALGPAKRLRSHLLHYATAHDIRLPAHQEQGIDLADHLARQLQLDDAHDKLHRDVARTERWLSDAATDRLSRRVRQLTFVLAVIGVWAGLAGMNKPDEALLSVQGSWPWPFAAGVVPFVLVNAAAAAIIVGVLWAVGRLFDHLRGLD